MRKPAIPAINIQDPQIANIIRAMKENIEIVGGVRGGKITPLSDTASLSDVIAKVNAVLERLNG